MKETTKKKLNIIASACMTIGYACYVAGYIVKLKEQIKDFRKSSSPAK